MSLANWRGFTTTLFEDDFAIKSLDSVLVIVQDNNLYENPFEPIELRMVHKILKNAGYAPNWIELNKEIDILKANLDKDIENFKRYTQIVYSEKRNVWAIKRYEQKKENFYAQIRENLEQIWKKLLDYNLDCPLQLGRININIENEMSRIVKDIEKYIKDQKESEVPAS